MAYIAPGVIRGAWPLASGRRPDHYRVLSGNPNKLPTFGYRGYGLSDGSLSEEGLLCNAIAIAEWIMHVAGTPPFLGTAVGVSFERPYAFETQPVHLAGMLLVATFSDAAMLTATYCTDGLIPVSHCTTLSHLEVIPQPPVNVWKCRARIAEFVRACGGGLSRYHIT
uniref:Uncharacterized protein n=1 Tax=Coccidioides posadasii RMSCC 3488 TaxID=454284 RepID=A0A0J6FCH1_COCPO|nr:hypothetical protein CPAG_07017 [Coccidioides posadasii RMSCC 3488]